MSTKNRRTQLNDVAPHRPETGGQRVAVPDRILDAALEILAESGLRNLTQVQVANRAKVRQSHLTYYFPTRDDLLGAVTERAVNGIVSGFHRVATDGTKRGQKQLFAGLARSVLDLAHMRMFVAMIVEADADRTVRRLMKRATERIEAALAEALRGDDARERARLVLAAIWGLGLYQFLMRPASNASRTRTYLSWLTETSIPPQAASDQNR